MKVITDMYLRSNNRLYIDRCTDIYKNNFEYAAKSFLFSTCCKQGIIRNFYLEYDRMGYDRILVSKVTTLSGSVSYFKVVL